MSSTSTNATPNSRELRVMGLTGGMASGKSTVAKMLVALGAEVWDADTAAKSIYRENASLRSEILAKWGQELGRVEHGDIVDIHPAALAQIVFSDQDALTWLESKVHPAVGDMFNQWKHQKRGILKPTYLIREAAILFESGSHAGCDFTVTVEADERLRIDRAVSRAEAQGVDLGEHEVRQRLAHQWSTEQRIEQADWVIHNDDESSLLTQVLELHQRMLSLQ